MAQCCWYCIGKMFVTFWHFSKGSSTSHNWINIFDNHKKDFCWLISYLFFLCIPVSISVAVPSGNCSIRLGVEHSISKFLFLSLLLQHSRYKSCLLTVHKLISGSLPGRKHLFYINNLFAKIQIFLELTHWFIGVLELRIYDGGITFLLAHGFFNVRNSSGEIVKVKLLILMKLNLNETWKVLRGKTKKPLHYWNKGWT